jgi:hypothetical protein
LRERRERRTELGQHDSDEPTSAVGKSMRGLKSENSRSEEKRQSCGMNVRAKLDGRGVVLEVARGEGVGLLEVLAQHDALPKGGSKGNKSATAGKRESMLAGSTESQTVEPKVALDW